MPGRSDAAAHGVAMGPTSIKAARSGTVYLVSFITVSPASVWINLPWYIGDGVAPAAAALGGPLLWEKQGEADLGRPLGRGSTIVDRVVIYCSEQFDRLFANFEDSSQLGS